MGKKRKPAEKLLEAARREEEQKQKSPRVMSNAEKAEQLKAKPGELPAKHVMVAIADSVHDAVTSVFDDLEKAGLIPPSAAPKGQIRGRCMYYAAAGQLIASAITGRDYYVQVGTLGFKFDDKTMVKFDAANGGIDGRRFHMWLGADDGGLVDYVDFTSRFFKDWVIDSGAEWKRDDLPDYLWGTQKDIKEQYRVYYQVEVGEEPAAGKMIEANEAIITKIAERAAEIASKKLLD